MVNWIRAYISVYLDATNNGAESYHKTLKSIIKTPHPNVWKFIACLDNIISDNDTELQRLIQDLAQREDLISPPKLNVLAGINTKKNILTVL